MTFVDGLIWADDPLANLTGRKRFDLIYVRAFFHLFGLPNQIAAAVKLASFHPDKYDALILGWNVDTVKSVEMKLGPTVQAHSFSHGPDSFRELWGEFGMQTHSRWLVEATLHDIPKTSKRFASSERWGEGHEEMRFLKWSVRRAVGFGGGKGLACVPI